MKRWIVFCILCFFLLANLGPTATAQSAKDILVKMIDAQGGRANLEKVKDTTMSGSLEMVSMGISGSITLYQKEPDKMRMDMEFMGMMITQAFDGEIAWAVDPTTGSIAEMPEDEAKDFKRRSLGNDSLLNPQKYGITYTYKGKETLEGKEYHLLEQAFEDGDTSILYIDTKTYLMFKTTARVPNQMGVEVDQEAFLSDYKKVDGMMIPFETRVLQDGEEFVVMVFTEIEFNTGLEDSLFKKEE